MRHAKVRWRDVTKSGRFNLLWTPLVILSAGTIAYAAVSRGWNVGFAIAVVVLAFALYRRPVDTHIFTTDVREVVGSPAARGVLVAALPSILQSVLVNTSFSLVALLSVLLMVCVLADSHGRNRSQRPPSTHLLGWAIVFGLGTSVWPLLVSGASAQLSFYIPAALYFVAKRVPVRRSDLRPVIIALWLASSAYAGVHVFWRVILNQGTDGLQQIYSHEYALWPVLGCVAALALRRLGLLLISGGLLAAIFWDYPAASYVVALAVALAVFIAAAHRLWGISLVSLVLAFAIAVPFLLVAGILDPSEAQEYFAAAGKGDNTDTRLMLWRQALETWEQNVLLGTLNQEQVGVRLQSAGSIIIVPPHNDFLAVASGAGLVGLLPLIAGLWLTLRSLLAAVGSGILAKEQMLVLRIIVAASCVTIALATFNPILANPAASAPFWYLLGLGLAATAPLDAHRATTQPSRAGG